MKNFIFMLPFLLLLQVAHSQNKDIIKPIKDLFDGMREGNAEQIASAFTDDAMLETWISSEGETKIQRTPANAFIEIAGQPHSETWNEVIWSYDIRQDGPLATVWTEYTFYLGKQLSHCGVNAFQMIESKEGWKINRITDTRRKSNCRTLDNQPEDQESVLSDIDKQVWEPFKAAYSEFDAQAMNALHSEDVIRATRWNIRSGETYKSHLIKQYGEASARGDRREISFKFDMRKVDGDNAVETGVYHVVSTRDNRTSDYYGYFHVRLRKIDDRWKITYDFDTDEVNGLKVNRGWLE